MNIIITGGTGLIGSALAASLAKDGHAVTVLTRSPARAQSSLPAGVKAAAWDGKSAAHWGALAGDADAIVNLAGESISGESLLHMRWTPERKHRILQSRLDAGQAVVEAVRAAQNKPALVVQASAVGYYGALGAQPVDESAPNGSDFLAAVCREWEASTQEIESLGVRRAVIRTGVVLSAHGGALPLQMLPFKFFVGGPIGSGKQGYPWIHIADEVRAIRFLIETPQASGAFNLTAPTLVNNAEFSRALGKALRRPAFLPAPGFAFRLAFGEAAAVLLDGQKPHPKRLLDLGFQFAYPDPLPALQNLLRQP